MIKQVFVVHGFNGRPEGGWRPWLKIELEKKGFVVHLLKMPSPRLPSMNAWIKEIQKNIQTPNENTFLVGHSLGCIAILRYLESLKGKQKVGGAILVAGLATNLGNPLFSSFFRASIDWKKIQSHCNKFVSINSDNDRFVTIAHGKAFEKNLGARLIIKKGMGHFSGDEGCFKLPVVLEEILKLAKK
ncbi:serine hydrolase family protein [Candidatus Micrarchaeota archaeon]|nr:serine hydrolase family protein [Candidatus Micrarchaeota archaeon]